MLKIMLVDDEAIALEELKHRLSILADEVRLTIVGSFNNPLEAFFNIGILNPDVIFLDIDMPEVSGIYLAEQIMTKYPDLKIIFVTAFNKYAIDAFELNAVDYILKPITYDRLKKSLARIHTGNHTNRPGGNLSSVGEYYDETVKKIFVYEEDDIILLSYQNIYYLEALNKSVKIRTKDRFYLVNQPINYFESKLKSLNFFRCHRSYLVNLDKVHKILAKIQYSYDIELNDISDLVPVSRNQIKLLKQLLVF